MEGILYGYNEPDTSSPRAGPSQLAQSPDAGSGSQAQEERERLREERRQERRRKRKDEKTKRKSMQTATDASDIVPETLANGLAEQPRVEQAAEPHVVDTTLGDAETADANEEGAAGVATSQPAEVDASRVDEEPQAAPPRGKRKRAAEVQGASQEEGDKQGKKRASGPTVDDAESSGASAIAPRSAAAPVVEVEIPSRSAPSTPNNKRKTPAARSAIKAAQRAKEAEDLAIDRPPTPESLPDPPSPTAAQPEAESSFARSISPPAPAPAKKRAAKASSSKSKKSKQQVEVPLSSQRVVSEEFLDDSGDEQPRKRGEPSMPPSSNPFISQKAAKRARASAAGSSQGGRVKETDDELRRKFKVPGAMNAWLAEGWRDLKELGRLEEAGILTYRRGKFVEEEKDAIRASLELFKHLNRLDDSELQTIIMGKGRQSERKDFPKFWPEVAAHAPGRPVKAVKDFVRRDTDPRGNKGKWQPKEDAELLRAYEVHPNEWAKIAMIVDRTETDCRDRYKNELKHKETRKTGHWDDMETRNLARIVKEANETLGNDPLGYEAPWDVVCERMGGERSRTQCRKKWQEQLRPIELSKGDRTRFGKSDKHVLVTKLKRLDVLTEGDVDWQSLCVGPWSGHVAGTLRNAFRRMKLEVSDDTDTPFSQLLAKMEDRFPPYLGSSPRSSMSKSASQTPAKTPSKLRQEVSASLSQRKKRQKSRATQEELEDEVIVPEDESEEEDPVEPPNEHSEEGEGLEQEDELEDD